MEFGSDTIFAPASGYGRAAVCVLRVSGPLCRDTLSAFGSSLPTPRRLSLRNLKDPKTGELLDEALVVFMPGPHSFTGEDQLEIHLHGGLATRAAVLRALSGLDGCRAARPGEFTRRAFVHGRMDLSRAEGLADLIDAETEGQRRQALRQLGGALGSAVAQWRETILHSLALLEASLDFIDEDDVPEGLEDHVAQELKPIAAAIAAALSAPGAERMREGLTVVIAGPPNAGKSTLLNALARRDVAIVSPIAGTTRDVLEVRCELDGLPVTFVDTAGQRSSDDPLEQEGVARARLQIEKADLVLWLCPADGQGEEWAVGDGARGGYDFLKVQTKCDLGCGAKRDPAIDLGISAKSGAGMSDLLATITTRANRALGNGDALITRERHRTAFQQALTALERALHGLEQKTALELCAEEVRIAMRAMGSITGHVDVEHVLDRLFSSFCIGK